MTTKTRFTLLPLKAVRMAADVMTICAEKYPSPVWKQKSVDEHVDAAFRHITDWKNEGVDSESNKSHLAHAAVRLLMACEQELRSVKATEELVDALDEASYWRQPCDRAYTHLEEAPLPEPVEDEKYEKWLEEMTPVLDGWGSREAEIKPSSRARVGDVVEIPHWGVSGEVYSRDENYVLFLSGEGRYTARDGEYRIVQLRAAKLIDDYTPEEWDNTRKPQYNPQDVAFNSRVKTAYEYAREARSEHYANASCSLKDSQNCPEGRI